MCVTNYINLDEMYRESSRQKFIYKYNNVYYVITKKIKSNHIDAGPAVSGFSTFHRTVCMETRRLAFA